MNCVYVMYMEMDYETTHNKMEETNDINEKEEVPLNYNLELGDVIEFTSPSNVDLHNKTFFVTYIDEVGAELTNVNSFTQHRLKFDEEGNIRDESIERIVIRSRSDEKGYARQHLLLPKTWIDIHFAGEVPISITGEITNLEEDMIEVKTYPDLDTIYIDFGYKGVPKTIPIDNINIRAKPASLEKIESLKDIQEHIDDGNAFDPTEYEQQEASIEYNDVGEALITLPKDAYPDKSFRERLQGMYNAAKDITSGIGRDLDDVTHEKEIPEWKKRYGIEAQVTDMTDVLMSEIPDHDRTDRATEYVRMLITRFRELRTRFSKFDENGTVYDRKINGKEYKPLVEHLQHLNSSLKWILPVVATKKKVYDFEVDDLDTHVDGFPDISQYQVDNTVLKDGNAQESYAKGNQVGGDVSKYLQYYQSTHQSSVPYELPDQSDDYLAPEVTVQQSFDAIIHNLDNFHSTVSKISGSVSGNFSRRQFVIQRYGLGNSYLAPSIAKTGKKVYSRSQMNANDTATVRSFMVLPKPVLNYSRIGLPGSSIMTKSQLSHNHLYLFRLLHQKTDVSMVNVDEFSNELTESVWDEPIKSGEFNKQIRNFVLDEQLEHHPDRFDKFLQSVMPDTTNIIRLLTVLHPKSKISSLLSLRRATNALEPFLVYSDDLNYSQYNSIRFFVKNAINDYRVRLNKLGDEIGKHGNYRYRYSEPGAHPLETLFMDDSGLFNIFKDEYHLKSNKGDDAMGYSSSSEWMSKIFKSDNVSLFSDILRLMMISLITPKSISDALESNESEDMGKNEKIKAGDCIRRVLTKKYTSLKDLQTDNGNAEVFYDKDYDETPYDILNKYKEEKKRFEGDDLIDFLEETLIQKHDCPPKMARELAVSIISGKKLVQEGEFALLEIAPTIPSSNNSPLSEKDKRDNEKEVALRKKVAYYRRVKNQWVHDESIDEEAFIDTNTLFCNMSKICFRDDKKKICDSAQDAKSRLQDIQRKKMLDEFDGRLVDSMDSLKETLSKRVQDAIKSLKGRAHMKYILENRADIVAFNIGRGAKEVTVVKSPHKSDFDEIMGQSDFVKKQKDVVTFVERYCREAMVDIISTESAAWCYCKDSNAPLVPSSIYLLACAFMSNTYMQKLNELCATRGVLSADGDKIEDKETGYALRSIDFVSEDGYDEHGYKIATSDVIDEDAGETMMTVLENKRKNNGDRVFENEDTEHIHKLYKSISMHLSIPTNDIEEFVLRVSQELITDDTVITNQALYERDAKRKKEKENIKSPPYKDYRNKLIILIVASVILIAIQTSTPSFVIHKTFPGCTQSFRGFPENDGAIEDTSGVEYIACVLDTIKSKKSSSWKGIQRIPMESIKAQMIATITRSILPRIDIMELYIKKREYLVLHPDTTIPKDHSLDKWIHFMPPVIPFQIAKTLKGIPSDYKNELVEMQKTGDKNQRNQRNMFNTKITQFSYAVFENINQIVRKKGLLMKTAGGIYFTENTCCNDKQTRRAMDYFEDINSDITVHLRMAKGWSKIIENFNHRTTPPFLFDPKRSGLTYTSEISDKHFEPNIYAAFIHYCNLNTQVPIPEEMRGLFPEKIAEYNPTSSLLDKIELLKTHGYRFTHTNLLQLMEIVNRQNMVSVDVSDTKGTRVSGILDLFAHIDSLSTSDDDIVLCSKFRELLGNVLTNYDPKIMVVEDSDDTYKLNNWLTRANSELHSRITSFVGSNSNLTHQDKNKLNEQMLKIHMWDMDIDSTEGSMHTVVQFIRNSIFEMSRVYPEMIINNHIVRDHAHKHWGFAQIHNADITKIIQDYSATLDVFKHDITIHTVLKHVQTELTDVSTLLNLIPTFLPIYQTTDTASKTYYSLFTKRTLYMIYTYVWYSVLYEYIKAAEDDEMVQMDTNVGKDERRTEIRENRENQYTGVSTESNIHESALDHTDGLTEMHIRIGDRKLLHERVSDLIVAFVNINMNNKKKIDVPYDKISKGISRSKLIEKKTFTDFFKEMEDDQRTVEFQLKHYKMGRWNVGLQKGLVNYDKERYKEERKQLFEQLSSTANVDEHEDVIIQRTADEMDEDEERENVHVNDMEENDFQHYGGVDNEGEDGDDGDDF